MACLPVALCQKLNVDDFDHFDTNSSSSDNLSQILVCQDFIYIIEPF